MKKETVKAAVTYTPIAQPAPIVSVLAVNKNFLEQLYPSRGECALSKCNMLSDSEYAVGYLVNGAGVLIRDADNNRLRLAWPYCYALGQGVTDVTKHQALFDTLPQLFVD